MSQWGLWKRRKIKQEHQDNYYLLLWELTLRYLLIKLYGWIFSNISNTNLKKLKEKILKSPNQFLKVGYRSSKELENW